MELLPSCRARVLHSNTRVPSEGVWRLRSTRDTKLVSAGPSRRQKKPKHLPHSINAMLSRPMQPDGGTVHKHMSTAVWPEATKHGLGSKQL
jgi:hypothetical protein